MISPITRPAPFLIEGPPWASGWGEDSHGLYAEFELEGEVQRMRWLEPGRFWMGSLEGEAERFSDESRHEVELALGYWLADTACTQGLWLKIMGENPSLFKEQEGWERRPVESVSWEDCQEFLKRLNRRVNGLEMRLPTEAEWEYACRGGEEWERERPGGTETPFWFGSDLTVEKANYDGNYPYTEGRKGKWLQTTVGVKEYARNPRGLYQMHGNVWEWCEDWYGPYEEGPVKDPRGPDEGETRMLRGGSWHSHGRSLRSAYRRTGKPGIRYGSRGFRLARDR